jgi:hypothetical protein
MKPIFMKKIKGVLSFVKEKKELHYKVENKVLSMFSVPHYCTNFS